MSVEKRFSAHRTIRSSPALFVDACRIELAEDSVHNLRRRVSCWACLSAMSGHKLDLIQSPSSNRRCLTSGSTGSSTFASDTVPYVSHVEVLPSEQQRIGQGAKAMPDTTNRTQNLPENGPPKAKRCPNFPEINKGLRRKIRKMRKKANRCPNFRER